MKELVADIQVTPHELKITWVADADSGPARSKIQTGKSKIGERCGKKQHLATHSLPCQRMWLPVAAPWGPAALGLENLHVSRGPTGRYPHEVAFPNRRVQLFPGAHAVKHEIECALCLRQKGTLSPSAPFANKFRSLTMSPRVCRSGVRSVIRLRRTPESLVDTSLQKQNNDDM